LYVSTLAFSVNKMVATPQDRFFLELGHVCTCALRAHAQSETAVQPHAAVTHMASVCYGKR